MQLYFKYCQANVCRIKSISGLREKAGTQNKKQMSSDIENEENYLSEQMEISEPRRKGVKNSSAPTRWQ